MNYGTLTERNTRVWLLNFAKTIKLNELLIEKSRDRNVIMQNEYTSKYRSSALGKFLYKEKCELIGSRIYESYSSWFSLKLLTPYTVPELILEDHTDDYFYNRRDLYLSTYERWSKYATQPFTVDEKDVIFYQELVEFHEETIKVAKGVGMDYEAFNLDEYRENRG